MEKSENHGMQTFDSHLYKLYKEGIISLEEAMKNADSPSNLQVKFNLEENSYSNMSDDDNSDATNDTGADLFEGLSLESMEESKKEKGEIKTPQELMEEKIAKRLKEDAKYAEELK